MVTITVDKDGTIRYKNERGLFHREDGPAFESPDGFKAWILNGIQHREDGPATILPSGTVLYYLNGKMHSKEDWEIEIIKIRLERLKDL